MKGRGDGRGIESAKEEQGKRRIRRSNATERRKKKKSAKNGSGKAGDNKSHILNSMKSFKLKSIFGIYT